jgi:hypothetical protein
LPFDEHKKIHEDAQLFYDECDWKLSSFIVGNAFQMQRNSMQKSVIDVHVASSRASY